LVSLSVFGFADYIRLFVFAERVWFRHARLFSPSVFGFAERVWFLRTRFVSLRFVISIFLDVSSDLIKYTDK